LIRACEVTLCHLRTR